MRGKKVDSIQIRFEKNGKYKTIMSIPVDEFIFMFNNAYGMLGGIGLTQQQLNSESERYKEMLKQILKVTGAE
ncbi:MAG: hypothetical protein V4598_06515 [Bdellovibrionota bacterium]